MATRLMAIILLLLFGTASVQAADESRIALVIGNDDYQYAPKLGNAVNDARGVASVLSRAGFTVIDRYNLTARQFSEALDEFAADLPKARVGLVYYAGHGIQFEGSSYLVPIDVDLTSERDVRKAIPAEYIISDAGQASQIGILILDACRDNPFVKQMAETVPSRSIGLGRGLSRLQSTPKKTLIAYATQAGNVALDGAGTEHSPYANALMKFLATPGRDVRLTFGAIRDEVLALTDGKQEPYIYGSLGAEEIYLVPRTEASASADVSAAQPEVANLSQLNIPNLSSLSALPADYIAWKTALETNSLEPLARLDPSAAGYYKHVLYPALVKFAPRFGGNVSDTMGAIESDKLRFQDLDADARIQVQIALRSLNFYGGEVSGSPSNESSAGLRSFASYAKGVQTVTYGLLAMLGEQSATRASASPLTGTWTGEYRYPRVINGVSSVNFAMELTFSGGKISGSIIEPNTFGDNTSKNLYANFVGKIAGDKISWKKQYDGTAGVGHAVMYEGKLNRKNLTVIGTWSIPGDWSGTFTLSHNR